MDKASVSGAEDWGFESPWWYFFCLSLVFFFFFSPCCCALVRCFLLHTHCLHWAGSSQSMPEPACGAALLCMTPALALAATTSAVRCWTFFNRQRDLLNSAALLFCTAMAPTNHCTAMVADVRALGAAAVLCLKWHHRAQQQGPPAAVLSLA